MRSGKIFIDDGDFEFIDDADFEFVSDTTGWTGKICGVTNPSKICGVLTADIGGV